MDTVIPTIAFLLVCALLVFLIYLAWTRWRRIARMRSCPRCGRGVPIGELECPHCEFDFRSIGA